MKRSSYNDISIYDLSQTKKLPDWLTQKQKRSLSKDEEYRKRIELIQDFEFKTASQCIKMSQDNNFIGATGVYPPSIKMFDVNELSMKFERRLDAEVVDFLFLSNDFGKLAFLTTDRTISFHAPYGKHHSLRVPKFGRCLSYVGDSCELMVGCAGSEGEIYCLDLSEGRWADPIQTSSSDTDSIPGTTCFSLNPRHMMLAAGYEDGGMEMFDLRDKSSLDLLNIPSILNNSPNTSQYSQSTMGEEISYLQFDDDGYTLGVGTSKGRVGIWDIRSSNPFYIKVFLFLFFFESLIKA